MRGRMQRVPHVPPIDCGIAVAAIANRAEVIFLYVLFVFFVNLITFVCFNIII